MQETIRNLQRKKLVKIQKLRGAPISVNSVLGYNIELSGTKALIYGKNEALITIKAPKYEQKHHNINKSATIEVSDKIKTDRQRAQKRHIIAKVIINVLKH